MYVDNIKMGLLRMKYIRRLTILIVLIMLCVGIFIISRSNIIDEWDQKARLVKIEETIRNFASSAACRQPNLPVNSPELNKFLREVPPIDCSRAGYDWVVCENSECRIRENIKMEKGNVVCSFTDLIRKSDFSTIEGETTNSDSYYKLERSDVVKVQCKSREDSWSSILTGIRLDQDIWERAGWQHVPSDGLKLNVLMFGFDSISRNTFIRKLPQSYKYLTESLGGLVLEGYNIVGDGTPQALTPMLTGATELELPDVRKRYAKTEYVNVYPFIWKDFKNSGYVTAFLEDLPDTGIYTYRLRGFNTPPTDHYMRPYYVATSKLIRKWPPLCSGSVPRHKVMMNYIKHFFSVYKSKPKFLFGFHGELSHDDYNLVGTADEDLMMFLKDLNESRALNDTLLILMADHGHRFAEIRNTIQGKQEERLPFFSFRFPTWFKSQHKKIYDNFVSNIKTITTPFDIYSTLKSVLHYDHLDVGSLNNRSISLFTKIPEERSCAHAYIEPHWCACLEWNNIDLSLPIVQKLSNQFIGTINSYTSSHRDLCALLEVSEVMWVTKLRPNENLIKFNKNADMDGFVPDMSSNMHLQSHMYQMKVLVSPGDSIFEVSMTHYLKTDTFELKMGDVSRINKYGTQASCIETSFPNLRKYCFCKIH